MEQEIGLDEFRNTQVELRKQLGLLDEKVKVDRAYVEKHVDDSVKNIMTQAINTLEEKLGRESIEFKYARSAILTAGNDAIRKIKRVLGGCKVEVVIDTEFESVTLNKKNYQIR